MRDRTQNQTCSKGSSVPRRRLADKNVVLPRFFGVGVVAAAAADEAFGLPGRGRRAPLSLFGV